MQCVQMQVRFERHDRHVLVRHGVYAWVRHPGYLGFLLWAAGTQLLLANPACLALFVAAVSRWNLSGRGRFPHAPDREWQRARGMRMSESASRDGAAGRSGSEKQLIDLCAGVDVFQAPGPGGGAATDEILRAGIRRVQSARAVGTAVHRLRRSERLGPAVLQGHSRLRCRCGMGSSSNVAAHQELKVGFNVPYNFETAHGVQITNHNWRDEPAGNLPLQPVNLLNMFCRKYKNSMSEPYFHMIPPVSGTAYATKTMWSIA